MLGGKLLQSVRGEWMETVNVSLIAVNQTGDITIRHADTNALQVDTLKVLCFV
jgi:hypothetical protein